MNIVKIRGLSLGEGRPKICVPITGRTREEICLRVKELKDAEPDLAEWRADWYEKVREEEALKEMLAFLRRELGELPLLVTFRTKEEGGERELSISDYRRFLKEVLDSAQADLLDVELSKGSGLLKEICKEAHAASVGVVASSHDFQATPDQKEIIRRLREMQDCGADLLKLAAMPRSAEDVLTLLSATVRMRKEYARQPVITMSMGKTGLVSRLCGEAFGSALTFGSAGVASAPGQIGAQELRQVLEIIHRNSGGESGLQDS